MLTKKDARGTISTSTYDVAGRVVTRSFTDGTPSVSLTYDDAAISYSKGKLTSVVSSISTTSFSNFDRLGRVTGSSQTLAGISQPYTMTYSYSIAGNLISETYPSGRIVTNTVDDAGQLSKVTSQEAGQTERTYAQNFAFSAAGMIERVRLGNARWENYQYNNRLQITQIELGASAGNSSLLKLNFEYATTGNHDNNGTLLKQTITLPGSATALVQSYSYDALNRLQSATEMYGSSQSWKQTFVFDRFGNRTFNTSGSNTSTLPSSFNANIFNPTIDTSNNRYSSGQGYSYDAAGNVTANAAGHSFEYDAEHHQTKVKLTSTSATVATYQYDGTGQRVKKIVGTEETIFIYDAMGKSVAEYTLNATTSPTVKTRYMTQDHLGSPRVITDGIGQVQERHDYLAYGEDASSSLSSVRTTAQKYVSANLRQRYTGYERDDESGLDFAQARYYSSAHGRFTSVDPLTASATIKNPQTFNRYSYALNSPYKFTDPLGLSVQVGNGVNDPKTDPTPQVNLTGVIDPSSIAPTVQLPLLVCARARDAYGGKLLLTRMVDWKELLGIHC